MLHTDVLAEKVSGVRAWFSVGLGLNSLLLKFACKHFQSNAEDWGTLFIISSYNKKVPWRAPGYGIASFIYIVVAGDATREAAPHSWRAKRKGKTTAQGSYRASSYCSSCWLCGNYCLQNCSQNFSSCSSSGEAITEGIQIFGPNWSSPGRTCPALADEHLGWPGSPMNSAPELPELMCYPLHIVHPRCRNDVVFLFESVISPQIHN